MRAYYTEKYKRMAAYRKKLKDASTLKLSENKTPNQQFKMTRDTVMNNSLVTDTLLVPNNLSVRVISADNASVGVMNVGVGTTSPIDKLYVAGRVNSDYNTAHYRWGVGDGAIIPAFSGATRYYKLANLKIFVDDGNGGLPLRLIGSFGQFGTNRSVSFDMSINSKFEYYFNGTAYHFGSGVTRDIDFVVYIEYDYIYSVYLKIAAGAYVTADFYLMGDITTNGVTAYPPTSTYTTAPSGSLVTPSGIDECEMNILQNGNVGIGTRQPEASLHIVGASNETFNALSLQNNSSANTTDKKTSIAFNGADTIGTVKKWLKL